MQKIAIIGLGDKLAKPADIAKHRKAEAAINGSSLIAKDKNGVIIENPLLKIQERCIKIMEQFGRINNTDFLWNDDDEKENP